MTTEVSRRASAKTRIFNRLSLGPATNAELNTVCFRFGARIEELRKEGVGIVTVAVGRGKFRYELTGGANA